MIYELDGDRFASLEGFYAEVETQLGLAPWGHNLDAFNDILERKLGRCHPTNVPGVRADLAAAHRGEGPTLFDILVQIIREHGPGGSEADDGVVLELA